MNDFNLSKFLKIPPGSTLFLNDQASLEESKKENGTFKMLEYNVTRTARLVDGENLAEWGFIAIERTKPDNSFESLLLVAQTVDKVVDFFVYDPTSLPVKNRVDNIKDDNLWLFSPPEDESNFKPIDLKFAAEIEETTDDGKHYKHIRKDMGERTGHYTEKPSRSGLHNLLATFVPYASESGRQALILEVGEADSEDGGAITLYSGRQIDATEIVTYIV